MVTVSMPVLERRKGGKFPAVKILDISASGVIEEEIERDDQNVTLKVSRRIAEILEKHRVFVGWGNSASLIGQAIRFPIGAVLEPYSTFYAGLSLCSIGIGSYLHSPVPLPDFRIGRYCSIAVGLSVLGLRHPMDRLTSSNVSYELANPAPSELALRAMRQDHFSDIAIESVPVAWDSSAPVVEHDVWIGQQVTLQRGITIGVGAVVGAGALVTKHVEPFTIVGGVPARPIRRRFSDKLCERVLATEWWRYHPRRVLTQGMRDVERFLGLIEEDIAKGAMRPYQPPQLTLASLEC